MNRIHYAICASPLGWHDPHAWDHAKPIEPVVRHRTPITAAKRYDKLQRQCQATNGINSRLPVKIGRSCADGGYERLTPREREIIWEWSLETDQ